MHPPVFKDVYNEIIDMMLEEMHYDKTFKIVNVGDFDNILGHDGSIVTFVNVEYDDSQVVDKEENKEIIREQLIMNSL